MSNTSNQHENLSLMVVDFRWSVWSGLGWSISLEFPIIGGVLAILGTIVGSIISNFQSRAQRRIDLQSRIIGLIDRMDYYFLVLWRFELRDFINNNFSVWVMDLLMKSHKIKDASCDVELWSAKRIELLSELSEYELEYKKIFKYNTEVCNNLDNYRVPFDLTSLHIDTIKLGEFKTLEDHYKYINELILCMNKLVAENYKSWGTKVKEQFRTF